MKKQILFISFFLITLSVSVFSKTQDQLFAEWQAPPNNIPAAVCVKLLAQYPQLLSDANPVTWTTMPGSIYKAGFIIMAEPAIVTIGGSATGFVIQTVEQKCSQEYLPENIKNAIKELYPTWSGTGVYTSPVIRIKVTIVTNGNPLPAVQNVYNVAGVDASFLIDFDTPTITNASLKQTVSYRVKSTVQVLNKQGDIP
jgi:hypothetical protein